MKNYLFHSGIDISKLKLDVNLLNSQTLQSEHFVIDNNPNSIKEFVKLLIKRKIDVKDIDIRNYVKHILRTGKEAEKREIIGCFKSKILLVVVLRNFNS